MYSTNLAFVDNRGIDRDEVHYRARATGPDGTPVNLLIVNISPHGLMARCEVELREFDMLKIALPVVGTATAETRWWLGGRTGCQFKPAIDLATYYSMLSDLIRRT